MPDSKNITLKVRNLRKAYESRMVFHRLGFEWAGPGMVCVNGPNGSGKSTLLSMLGGANAPDQGDIVVQGASLVSKRDEALARVSYVPDNCPVYPFVTGVEWLEFVRAARRPSAWNAPTIAQAFRLDPYLNTRFGAMSLGTARKFMLAAGLGAPASVLVLDEPTNGLDTASFDVLREQLKARAASGLVVLCCHDVQERHVLGARCIDLLELETK